MMTPSELTSIGESLYGKRWKTPMARDAGYSYFTIYRAAKGTVVISHRLERDVRALVKDKGKGREL